MFLQLTASDPDANASLTYSAGNLRTLEMDRPPGETAPLAGQGFR